MISTYGFAQIHPDNCARTLGRDMRTCRCCLSGGGWLPCPPEAQGVLVPVNPTPLAPLEAGAYNVLPMVVGDSVQPTLVEVEIQRESARALLTNAELANEAVLTVRDSVRGVREYQQTFATEAAAIRVRAPGAVDNAIERGDNFVAKAAGYTGNICEHCGSVRMRHAGTCEVCDDCGESGACG